MPPFSGAKENMARTMRERAINAEVFVEGEVVLDEREVDFDMTYTVDAEFRNRTYRWTGVRPERIYYLTLGMRAIFALPPKPVGDVFDPSSAATRVLIEPSTC
jgi:hypothetical protein